MGRIQMQSSLVFVNIVMAYFKLSLKAMVARHLHVSGNYEWEICKKGDLK
jgi:hypothetical protein